ncbi:hypothetical protein F8S12_22685 [Nostoc sp. WHI]|nr:hypothetical protein [Nostoc sp. WHI]
MFISSQLQSDDVHLRVLYQYVERFYSTYLTTGVARDTRSGKFCLSLVQLLDCPVVLISSLKLQPKDIGCQIAKSV